MEDEGVAEWALHGFRRKCRETTHFRIWQRKKRDGGGGTVRTRVMRAWAARRLGRAREEAAENSERGQVVGVHQARQES